MDPSHGQAGLPPKDHALWAVENLRMMREDLDRYEAGLDAGVCRVKALMRAYRNNYGVLVNALDAEVGDIPGATETVRHAEAANDALEDYVVFCRRMAQKHNHPTAMRLCRDRYRRIRSVIRYEDE